MAWETRNGRGSYYTRTKRVDGRVVREYIGTGPAAKVIADLDALEREERQRNRVEFQAVKETQRLIDRKTDKETRLIKTLTQAILLVNGYHNHKGQWRKKRNG